MYFHFASPHLALLQYLHIFASLMGKLSTYHVSSLRWESPEGPGRPNEQDYDIRATFERPEVIMTLTGRLNPESPVSLYT